MPAEPDKQVFTIRQGFIHGEPFDTAAGPFTDTVFNGNDEGRPVIPLNQARRGYADNSAVPAFTDSDEHIVITVHVFFNFIHGRLRNGLFNILPLFVQLM